MTEFCIFFCFFSTQLTHCASFYLCLLGFVYSNESGDRRSRKLALWTFREYYCSFAYGILSVFFILSFPFCEKIGFIPLLRLLFWNTMRIILFYFILFTLSCLT
eukprot:TRINITY_DN5349_c0_g4_i1.p1 TRINITY_DN5349_c0_g4~~TRINITY_DN5349_c0_g4_i1.p1  ORF type:complete len:104 (-),score=9.77 TRINITY_DN5349_c0_g4_i1:259-570(-)